MSDIDKWITVDKRCDYLKLRFRVKGFPKQFCVTTGLIDNAQNRSIVRLKRDQIATDIALERFDNSLERYKFHPGRNTPVSKISTDLKIKYKYQLGELWDKYTEFKKSLLAQTTILNRYKRIRNHIRRLPTQSLDKAAQIRDWIVKTHTNLVAYELLISFSDCCEWAMNSELISLNPFLKLKLKYPKRRVNEDSFKAFTLVERDLIIQAFEQHQLYSHYGPLIKFLFFTGCRLGEAFALQWSDIQENCTRIHFTKSCNFGGILKDTKNGKKRVFPTSPNSRLQRLLIDIRPGPADYNSKDLVFVTKTGRPVTSYKLNNIWNLRTQVDKGKTRRYPGIVRTLASYGEVPYLKPYATRHTFATWAIASGVSPDKVALWIGDEVKTVFKFYCHPNVVGSECPDF